MVYKPAGRRYYMVKFYWHGKLIRKSTRATDKKTARSIEAKIRTELAKGEFDILERKPAPTLSDFLKQQFEPFINAKLSKQATKDYYAFGGKMLKDSLLGNLSLDEINDEKAAQFVARLAHLSPSTINCPLRTLRHALKLAYEWGVIRTPIKITLVSGERQRERVVSLNEFLAYVELCRQPWRDVATLIYGTGMRPGEAYKLRWEHVSFTDDAGLIQIAEGKTKAARRLLPMLPEVRQALQERWKAAHKPSAGWVFPTESESGHLEESTAKTQHGTALKKLEEAKAAFDAWDKNGREGEFQAVVASASKLDEEYVLRHAETLAEGVKPFAPYCLRHTALTRLAESGCDAFTLARIAGHSSITITQRYCHPQADAIESAFRKLDSGKELVNEGSQQTKMLPESSNAERLQTLESFGA